MKLAIVGYGKMGKMVESLAPAYGFEVALKLDEFNNANFSGITAENFKGIDAAIEFSVPEAAVENIERISALGITSLWAQLVGSKKWIAPKQQSQSMAPG